jgi:hypothetical protein
VLVSDKHEFVIACPTKTGTTSLLALAAHYKRHGGDPEVFTALRGEPMTKHRMAPPPGKEHYKRIMIVRNERDRLVSMYEWLRRVARDEAIGRAIVKAEADGDRRRGWVEMLKVFVHEQEQPDYLNLRARRWGGARPYMWVDSLDLLSDVVRGDLVGQRAPWFRGGVVACEPIEAMDVRGLLHDLGVRDSRLLSAEVKRLNHTRVSARLFPTTDEYLMVRGARRWLDRLVWRI